MSSIFHKWHIPYSRLPSANTWDLPTCTCYVLKVSFLHWHWRNGFRIIDDPIFLLARSSKIKANGQLSFDKVSVFRAKRGKVKLTTKLINPCSTWNIDVSGFLLPFASRLQRTFQNDVCFSAMQELHSNLRSAPCNEKKVSFLTFTFADCPQRHNNMVSLDSFQELTRCSNSNLQKGPHTYWKLDCVDRHPLIEC